MAIVNFVWDLLSDNVLKETDESNTTTINYASAPNQFGEALAQHKPVGNTYFHYDGLGCTRNLTSSTETVVLTRTYTGFGETVSSSGLHNTVFGWNGAYGYYTDAENADFYVRRRTYNPDTGRWRSRDPLGFVDGPNVYVYVKNLVPNAVDQTGEELTISFLPSESSLHPNVCSAAQIAVHGINTNMGFKKNCWWVQFVEIICFQSDCIGDCHPNCSRVLRSDKIEFFEAWEVESFEEMLLSTLHEFAIKPVEGHCGMRISRATIAVYCGKAVDTYIRENFKKVPHVDDPNDPNTRPPVSIRLPESCGQNIATVPGDWYREPGAETPPFWNTAPDDGKELYGFSVLYKCCPGGTDIVIPLPSN